MSRRHALPLLAALLLAPAAPARATVPVYPAAYVFSGLATEDCYGCGTRPGHFTGTFTGVVGDHTYTLAPFTMTYTAQDSTGIGCVITATASGTAEVSDGVHTDSWWFNWTRTYDVVVVASTNDGLFVATYIHHNPLPCGAPATLEMHGNGYGV
jgi:hypothetical protein